MEIKYTEHAMLRMGERCISKDDIELLLKSRHLRARSHQADEVILLMGYVGDKGVVLILDESTENLITVRNMRDNEKKLFESKEGMVL